MNDEEIMRALQGKLRDRIASGDTCGPFYAAVVAADGTIVAEAANSVVPEQCSHNHAEMNAIRLAEEKLGSWNLAQRGLTLYTTAEPCMMCVGGILWSGIERVVYGVGTESVERIAGFDEGFKPHWREEFAARGISVTGPVLPELGEEVLRLYVSMQGVVYSPRNNHSVASGIIPMALGISLTVALTGCKLLGLNVHGFANAWDEFRCDRRVAVFVNLRLDTVPKNQQSAVSTSPSAYNRALAYLHARGVSEVVFTGRTTAHGTLAEFRALNAGFSSVPDPAYKRGHATVTWTVPRVYRFAPEDTQGKYHPRTFWPRIFGTEWSDAYVSASHADIAREQPSASDQPTVLLKNYYGSRCRIQQFAYVSHESADDSSKKGTFSWDVVREWEEDGDGRR